MVELLPAALLAALIATQALGDGQRLTVDARLAGLAAAAVALCLRLPAVVVVLAAATTTALAGRSATAGVGRPDMVRG